MRCFLSFSVAALLTTTSAIVVSPVSAPAAKRRCPASAADERAAARAAAGCHGRVEVLAGRGEKTRVFANANGSFTAETAAVVQRVRDADGRWVRPDPTLRRDSGGRIVPGATALRISFSAGVTHSFAPTTAVLLADGKATKPIKDVKVGDRVLATDPITGRHSSRAVQAVHVHHDRLLTDLTVEVNGAKAVIHTTQHHPFWNKTKRMWVGATDLAPGDRLTSADGRGLRVLEVTGSVGGALMYDLTVSDVHTYHVLAGAEPVLVHNCPTGLLHPGRNGADDSPQDWIPMSAMKTNGANLQEGGHHFVVMPDKSVRAFHDSIWETAPGAGHTSLSRGEGVLAAGTFDVGPSGAITRFDNFSGHYQPSAATQDVIREALGGSGFNLSGARWDPF